MSVKMEEKIHTEDVIGSFDGDYAFLSNFYEAPIYYQGEAYLSSESAYQAQKDPTYKESFTWLTPMESKKLARKLSIREDWDEVKYDIMVKIVRAKFTQHKCLADKLIATGDRELVEGNYWKDTYWGVCEGVGENNLGKILMEIRQELLEK